MTDPAFDALPPVYAEALRLQRDGFDLDAIADRLDITAEAVGPLLDLATAKLAHRLEEGDS